MTLPVPFQRFQQWFDEARHVESRQREFNAMCLSTVGADGMPSSRIVLLKGVDADGFVFFTNKTSRKSDELRQNDAAALCFYWPEVGKQVRVEGYVEDTTDAESDAYFASRQRESQIGAWASHQSQPLDSRAALLKRHEEFTERFKGQDVPRPPHWGGWRIRPVRIEFWENGSHRLHNRELFSRTANGTWQSTLLNP
ncbi:MAG: pyridoxamine 5'-phosphate oxidase [Alphaproteobacteria bacterium]|nr:pyridoxamine 5'-phosphate oxidase [Alphaproteobacteria bacterium]